MIDISATQLQADLETHHIEGIARMDATGTKWKIPLIGPVTDSLWQGGCLNGVNLKGYFQHIVSLYPWERYNPGCQLQSFVEVTLYDSADMPGTEQLYLLARWINLRLAEGRVLVHCQAGLNRSGLVAGLALILEGIEPDVAIRMLRSARCEQVLCNHMFESWLRKQVPGASSSPSRSTTAALTPSVPAAKVGNTKTPRKAVSA
jgi:hypothetical protein